MIEIVGLGAELRVALDIDALDAAAIDKIVDVAAAPGDGRALRNGTVDMAEQTCPGSRRRRT